MKLTQKVLGINLLILLTYNIIVPILFPDFNPGWEHSILLGLCMLAHMSILFVLGIYAYGSQKDELYKACGFSMLVVLVIGFSACLGGMRLMNG